jgi:tRNA1(Val) A37 N6-methylase TrmN6
MENTMEYLPNGYTLTTGSGAFPLSTDSMLLSHFVQLGKAANVLDLGAGCGTLGILLCARDEFCRVTGVELSQQAHLAAEENIQRNHLQDRMVSICADLRDVSLPMGAFSVCVSNPPYFSSGPASKENPLARREDTCSPAQLFAAASKALKYGGDFFLVHKPERLSQLCACATNHKLEPKRLLLLRHREGDPISLVLLQCRKGAKPGLTIEEECLQTAGGEPSDYYRRLYHI